MLKLMFWEVAPAFANALLGVLGIVTVIFDEPPDVLTAQVPLVMLPWKVMVPSAARALRGDKMANVSAKATPCGLILNFIGISVRWVD